MTSNNGAACLVRKTPADHLSGPLFAPHVGNFGSGDVTVVAAYRIITMASTLPYAILERPRPRQTAILPDESGIHSLLHLASTEDDAARWLDAHPHRNARICPAGAAEPRLFTYLQDPGHGWLIVGGADLAAAGVAGLSGVGRIRLPSEYKRESAFTLSLPTSIRESAEPGQFDDMERNRGAADRDQQGGSETHAQSC